MARRNPASDEDQLDDRAQRHMLALGFFTTSAYQDWCTANGFPRKLRKHRNVRARERDVRNDEALRAKLRERRAVVVNPIDEVIAICDRRIAEHEITKPYLRRFFHGFHHVRRANSERYVDRSVLARVFRHLDGVRAKFFDGADVIASLGATQGNSYVEALVAIVASRVHWRRAIEDWRPRSHNARRQFATLLRHLFVEYDMPEFFDVAWFEGLGETSARHRLWYLRVGRGENIRHCDLPLPYTKRMAYYFLKAPATATITQALRWGQVRGLGGDERLANVLLATRLGETLENDDFWLTVVRWLIRHSMLDHEMIGPIVDFLHNQRFASQGMAYEGGRLVELPPPQPNLSMKDRSPLTLLEQVNAWHRRLARDNSHQVREWKPSGIKGFEFLEGSRENDTLKVWSIRELLGSKALQAEGRRMRHCVASYAYSCERGSCSIWTVECESRAGVSKNLTVEVRSDTRQIVQARGLANRMPTQREREILNRWASVAQLSIASYIN
jgi:hypothetical protein